MEKLFGCSICYGSGFHNGHPCNCGSLAQRLASKPSRDATIERLERELAEEQQKSSHVFYDMMKQLEKELAERGLKCRERVCESCDFDAEENAEEANKACGNATKAIASLSAVIEKEP